jgi:cell wall assembly regulator SMI1
MTAVMLTIDLLEALADRWRRLGAPIIENLRPGLSDAEIDALTHPLGISLPDEARTWFRWHDGVALDPGRPERRIGALMMEFIPLAEAVRDYQDGRAVLVGAGGEGALEDWPTSWFPITAQGCGDVVVCECSVPRDAATPIHVFRWDEPDPRPAAGSFGEMVALWIEAIDSARWVYDAARRSWYLDDSGGDPGLRFERLA